MPRPVLASVALLVPLAAGFLPARGELLHAAESRVAELTIMLAEPPRSMDPADQSATATRSVLAPFYETLVRQDETGALHPALATAWTSSADGLRWRFAIRPGLRFHDGTTCDAAAVAASLRRLIDPKAALAGSGIFREIISSAEQEAGDVVVTLRHPYAEILPLLSVTQAAIVSPRAAARGDLGRHADGTGPFVFVAWRQGKDVQAARNPAYWGPPPALDRLRWIWSPEPSVLNMALQTGDADIVDPLAPVFARLYAAGERGATVAGVRRAPGAALFWAALNTKLPPLDDSRVRRALGLAIDRDALVAGLLHGFGRPACHALTPDIAGARSCAPGEARAHLAQARALLAEAGHGSGFTIAVAVQEPEEPIAEALQAMWRGIGVTLEIRRQEAGVWVQSAFAPPEAKRRAGTGMIITSWSAPFIADLQLRPLYASVSAAPAGANLGFFSDDAVDAAINAVAEERDPAIRRQTLDDLQARLDVQAPILPLYNADTVYGVRRGVEGVTALRDGEIIVAGASLTGAALPAGGAP